ncbi:MAG: arsenite efflux transporter metallochaperone ArsD [Verrucomicrobiales bacterium]|nr:arsenite efflux transporter metallochaperone ArsD [Verrucomicrobiales bacterium]
MKTIQVFDPPMCCSTGLCGTVIDPALVSFAALLTELGQKGVKVERYNMGQQPMAFVQNPIVKAMIDQEGTEALPVVLLDGAVYLKGRYLTHEERVTLAHAVLADGAGATS